MGPARPTPRVRALLPLAYILVLLAGAALRFSFFPYMEWKGDEQTAVALARGFLDRPELLPHGLQSSLAVYQPPLFIYVVALFWWLTPSPLGVNAWITALNCAGLVLAAAYFWRRLGGSLGLTALLFFAVSPWAVIYSKKIWSQDLVLPFLIPAFMLFDRVLERPRSRALAPFLVLFTLASQMHLSVWLLAPALAWIWWRRRSPLHLPGLAAGVLFGVLAYAPYLAFTLSQGIFGGGRPYFLSRRSPIGIHLPDLKLITHLFAFVTGWGLQHFLSRDEYWRFLGWPAGYVVAALHLILLPLVLPAWLGLCELWRGVFSRPEPVNRRIPRGFGDVAVGALIGFPVIFLLSMARAMPHHLIPVFPYPYVAVALGFDRLRARWRGGWVTLWEGVSATAMAALYLLLLSFIIAQGGSQGDFGIPYALQGRSR